MNSVSDGEFMKRILFILLIYSASVSAEENDNFFSPSESSSESSFEQWSDAVPDHTPRLERLFTTPEQRAELDRNRRFPPPPSHLHFEGITSVQGDPSRVHVWINGTTQFEDGSFTVRVNTDRRSITVTLPGLGRSFRLLVGQTLDTQNAQVVEFYK